MTKSITIDVSIVTSKEDLILQCLRSLFDYNSIHCESLNLNVTVIWNNLNSTIPRRLQDYSDRIKLIESKKSGFAKNQNIVVKESRADYILLANDDIVFLPGTLEKTILFMERPENAKIGVLGPKLLNQDRTLQHSTYSFITIFRAILFCLGLRNLIPISGRTIRLVSILGMGRGRSRFWSHDSICDVDTFRGAYMLARGVAIKEVGLMDEVTLAGGEEAEWHYRFWQRGWRVVFYPEAEVIHLGSQTVKDDSMQEINYLIGYLNFFKKHRGKVAFYGFCLAVFFIYLTRFSIATISNNLMLRRVSSTAVRTVLEWV